MRVAMGRGMKTSDFVSLDALALSLIAGGDGQAAPQPPTFDPDKVPSGENGMTCRQALQVHCAPVCTNGLLAQYDKDHPKKK